jgi:hypothetical protein
MVSGAKLKDAFSKPLKFSRDNSSIILMNQAE